MKSDAGIEVIAQLRLRRLDLRDSPDRQDDLPSAHRTALLLQRNRQAHLSQARPHLPESLRPLPQDQPEEDKRLRLVLAPLNTPGVQKNYQSGGPPMQESIEDARTATIELHMTPNRPSALTLPARSDEAQ